MSNQLSVKKKWPRFIRKADKTEQIELKITESSQDVEQGKDYGQGRFREDRAVVRVATGQTGKQACFLSKSSI